MKKQLATATIILSLFSAISPAGAFPYTVDSTIPQSGGCPQPNHWNLSLAAPLSRRWSTAMTALLSPTILTVAAQHSPAQIAEINQTITDSFGVWSGVTGTTMNATAYPALFAPLQQVTPANSCSNDAENDVDGLNTICFNQSSAAFTSGVLAFTRTITANAPGAVIAGTLGGWSCDPANPPTQFDGYFDLERLPVGHSYNLYAEPLVGLALPGDFSDVFTGLCSSSEAPTCNAPPVNTNFNVRVLPVPQ